MGTTTYVGSSHKVHQAVVGALGLFLVDNSCLLVAVARRCSGCSERASAVGKVADISPR